jgi:hypothetical protein
VNRRAFLKTSAVLLSAFGGCRSQNNTSAENNIKSLQNNPASDSDVFLVGAAVKIINPKKPSICVGHLGTTAHSEVYADLRVQAMVIEDKAKKKTVLVGWDLCKAFAVMVDAVKKSVQEKHGIGVENICINASHTHSAPPVLEREAIAAPEYFDLTYKDFVVKQAIEAIDDAINNMMPATLRYCEYMCTSVGINRRNSPTFDPIFGPNFKEPVDHRAQVLAAESVRDKKLVAAMVKYACHPVTTGPAGMGPDYPGFMRIFVEKKHPGAVVVFMQGCAGDVRVQLVDDDVTTFVAGKAKDFGKEVKEGDSEFIGDGLEKAKQFGKDLGMAVEWALSKPGNKIKGPVRANYKVIELPIKKLDRQYYVEATKKDEESWVRWGNHFLKKLDNGELIKRTQNYRIQTLAFGRKSKNQLVITALQGETFTEYGYKIAEKLKPAKSIVLGYSNDMASYVPTARGLREGGYESNAFHHYCSVPGPYEESVEKKIIETAVRLAKR